MSCFDKNLNLALYTKISLIRKAEQTIIKYYAQDEMKTPMHMSFGQEAIAAGVCQALKKSDKVLSSYRTHALYLAKTGETDLFFAEMFGRQSGLARGKSGSMHLSSPENGYLLATAIVGTQLPVALGVAFAQQQLKTGAVTAVFFGDGAIEEGAFWESLNIACVKRLPLLFVLEDNDWAAFTSKKARHGFRDIRKIVAQYDCFASESAPVDAEDVYRATEECLSEMRRGSRPAFLRAPCYRHLEHVGVNYDFDAAYRSRAEYEEWLAQDPLVTQRRKLVDHGCAPAELDALDTALQKQIDRSITQAQQAPHPTCDDLEGGLFA